MTKLPQTSIILFMANELTIITPEGQEVANCYLTLGNIPAVADYMGMPQHDVSEILQKKEVKRYVDNVWLDTGYRNRTNIASVMDTMIAAKLEEAEESGIFSKKDLSELVMQAHKMRMDEIKVQQEEVKNAASGVKNQTNVQINDSQGNYGILLDKLINGTT